MGHLFLVGFMGAGKSSVGRVVAEKLGRPFVDLDEAIFSASGMSAKEIFASQGEEVFRALETEALLKTEGSPDSVVACGGGVVLAPANRETLRRAGKVIYLKVDAAEALARIGDKSTRPLLSGPSGALAATSILQARESLYAALADQIVDTRGRSIEEVASLIAEAVSGEMS